MEVGAADARLPDADQHVVDADGGDRNVAQLETAYRATLEACHACHTASEKPYLALQVPTAPAEPLIHFDAR